MSEERDKGTGIEATSQCHMPINKLFMWERVWDSLSITAQTLTNIPAHLSGYNGGKRTYIYFHTTLTHWVTFREWRQRQTPAAALSTHFHSSLDVPAYKPPLTSLLHMISEHNEQVKSLLNSLDIMKKALCCVDTESYMTHPRFIVIAIIRTINFFLWFLFLMFDIMTTTDEIKHVLFFVFLVSWHFFNECLCHECDECENGKIQAKGHMRWGGASTVIGYLSCKLHNAQILCLQPLIKLIFQPRSLACR